MSLLRDCIRLDPRAESPRARNALARAAEQFVRSGGAPTLSEWSALDELERAALIAARSSVDAERTALAGMAAQSLEGAARTLAPADGGAALVRVRLERALDRLETSESS